MKTKAGLEKFKTNMIDYMLKVYKKQITYPDQPLLFVNMQDQTIYLIPEFCHEASLPEDFTKDKQKMRAIDDYKIKDPQKRFQRTCDLVNQIFNKKEFQDWQIELDRKMLQLQGQVLPLPRLEAGSKLCEFQDILNRKIKHTEPMVLDDATWTFVYAAKNYDEAGTILENFAKAQDSMGIRVSKNPTWIEVPESLINGKGRGRGGEAFAEEIKRAVNPKTRIVLVLTQYPDQKKAAKIALDKLGVPSQFILVPTVRKPITVYTNLLKQMNSKIKQDLYRINIPKDFANAMVVGVDACHAGRDSIIGLAATYTPYFTQHYTEVAHQALDKENIGKGKDQPKKDAQEDAAVEKRISILQSFIQKALANYEKNNNKKLPDKIVVYRDGVGGPSMQEKVEKTEIKLISQAI